MAAEPPPPPRSGGLSLYANLLEPEGDAPGSISRAPVVSQEAIEAAKEQDGSKKPIAAALRFQPYQQIRRPQPKTLKPKASFPKVPPPGVATGNTTNSSATGGTGAAVAPTAAPSAPAKSTLAEWAATEEDEYVYGMGEKRARGGRRKKKKKFESAPMETDWDEIYDPSRPTNVEEYLRSEERIREVQEWKALLYKHRRRDERTQDSYDSEEDDERPMHNQFAPPDSYSFAPPPPSPPRAAPVPDDKTGDDAYARRLALSQGQAANVPPPPHSPTLSSAPLPPPPPPPPPPELDSSATISREPVRYTRPANPDAMDEDHDDDKAYVPLEPSGQEQEEEGEDAPRERSNRPGQKGFAARLMSKYGWAKGQGLGAESSGILQPLRVQIEKRKKKSDAEGGGWREPGGRGRIIGSKPGGSSSSGSGPSDGNGGSKFGLMSNVIVLRNMLEGMDDLQGEMENGLGQEIGEECGDNYGRVERLHIDIEGKRVYIKFTDQVSALRAVNALDGRVFAGNTIVPQYYDVDKFESRVYE
ncbi:hypothetical protein F4775DRAFT_567432 [Biscogniauxia sp. FL1348]|nr:hypothetical protein F4775DRAFT_567432 [Biscogniauxia sp. FL1348]